MMVRDIRDSILRCTWIATITIIVAGSLPYNPSRDTYAQGSRATPGTFRRFAVDARRRGASSTTVRPVLTYTDSEPLNKVLADQSAFLVRLVQLTARTDVLPADMQTWHVFEIEQPLSQRRQHKDARCTGVKHLVAGPNQLVIAFAGGTTVIDGVTVAMVPEPSYPLNVGERYLVFGDLCNGTRSFLLAHGLPDIFVVSESGGLSSRYRAGTFVSEVLALGSVERLKKRLTTIQ